MAVEIKTSGVKPLRNTFSHLKERFGDKPATRYQEIAYDTQPEVNFHYKPLWAPTKDIYDKSNTALVMEDWYALKDPRQYYYGSYTTNRAKQQEAIDRQMSFVDQRGLLNDLEPEVEKAVIFAFVVMRHYEWGANTNNNYIAAYGWGTIITQAASMAMADRLGLAQHLSRIGLLLDGKTGESLERAKSMWLNHESWQGVRRQVEDMFVLKDWFEVMVAQNLVADALLYALLIDRYDSHIADQHGSDLSSLNNYSVSWHKESNRWVDNVIKVAAAESDANKHQLNQWVEKWVRNFQPALATLAETLFPQTSKPVLAGVLTDFNVRLKKLGLEEVV